MRSSCSELAKHHSLTKFSKAGGPHTRTITRSPALSSIFLNDDEEESAEGAEEFAEGAEKSAEGAEGREADAGGRNCWNWVSRVFLVILPMPPFHPDIESDPEDPDPDRQVEGVVEEVEQGLPISVNVFHTVIDSVDESK